MSTPTASKKTTRQNSSTFTLVDIRNIIAETEQRILQRIDSKFEALYDRISVIETDIKSIKAVQVQQESDIHRIKEVIMCQQRQIESFEEKQRQCNLVITNMPEGEVMADEVPITNDKEKFVALANLILPHDEEIDVDDVEEAVRLGRRGGSKPCLMKVRLRDAPSRNMILRSCRNLNSPVVHRAFGKIYVNKDMSYLRRVEEKRLREEYRRLKSLHPDGEVRLKNGKLYIGVGIKDGIDVANQLF